MMLNETDFFVSGFMRGKSGVCEYGFVAALENDALSGITRISDEGRWNNHIYKHTELHGFTPEAKSIWSSLPGHEWVNMVGGDELEHIKLSDMMRTE